jgi:hypothetical protein
MVSLSRTYGKNFEFLIIKKLNSFEDEEKLMIGSKKDFLQRRTFVLHCIWFSVFCFLLPILYNLNDYYKCCNVTYMDFEMDFV